MSYHDFCEGEFDNTAIGHTREGTPQSNCSSSSEDDDAHIDEHRNFNKVFFYYSLILNLNNKY